MDCSAKKAWLDVSIKDSLARRRSGSLAGVWTSYWARGGSLFLGLLRRLNFRDILSREVLYGPHEIHSQQVMEKSWGVKVVLKSPFSSSLLIAAIILACSLWELTICWHYSMLKKQACPRLPSYRCRTQSAGKFNYVHRRVTETLRSGTRILMLEVKLQSPSPNPLCIVSQCIGFALYGSAFAETLDPTGSVGVMVNPACLPLMKTFFVASCCCYLCVSSIIMFCSPSPPASIQTHMKLTLLKHLLWLPCPPFLN